MEHEWVLIDRARREKGVARRVMGLLEETAKKQGRWLLVS